MPDKMPFRTAVISLEDVYEGWTVKTRLNVPFGTYMDILAAMKNAEVTDGQEVASNMHDLLELVVVEWDIKDELGDPIEVSRAGFAKIPMDLIFHIAHLAQREINKLPLIRSGNLPNTASQTGKKSKRRKGTSS